MSEFEIMQYRSPRLEKEQQLAAQGWGFVVEPWCERA